MIQLIVFRALQGRPTFPSRSIVDNSSFAGIGGSAIYSAVMVTISTMVPRVSCDFSVSSFSGSRLIQSTARSLPLYFHRRCGFRSL